MRKELEIEELAQNFSKAPRVEKNNQDAVLIFDFESIGGNYIETGIRFYDCLAYCMVCERAISDPSILQAYNAIVVVERLKWIKKLKLKGKVYNHYMIYFDDFGVYEFVAHSFEKLGVLK